MPTFAYSGRTRAGQTVTGERVADTMDAAVAALRREQIMVTRIDPAKAAAAAKAEAKEVKPGAPKTGKSVPAKNLAIFTRQFSVMIDAGLPLVQCLDILGKQEPHKNFAAVILKVREDVEGGAALADAMKKHPKTFDALYSNMIAAGEAGGILDTILKRLAVYIEKNVKLKGEVKSAMIYPIAVIVIAGLVVAAILWKVIPTFATLFAGLGAQLPLPTRVVIAASDVVVAYGLVDCHRPRRRRVRCSSATTTTDERAPRDRRDHAEAARSRQHPPQGRGGAVLPHALDAAVLGRADPRRPRHHRADGGQRHHRGRHPDDPDRASSAARPCRRRCARPSVFPSMVVQMINVGETTGALDAMLSKIADFYEDEVDTAVAGLLTLMEPVMIAFLGVVVGGIVIAMYMPIFDLISKLT